METAKVFWSGRSQAVRLPKQFRVEAREVRIRKEGNRIVMEPLPDDWNWLDAFAGRLDEDLIEAALQQPETPDRAEVERFFRR